MKANEIGHFPWLPPQHQFDKGGYPRKYLAKDAAGNIVWEGSSSKWLTNWAILGEVDLVDIPKGLEYGECLVDLQTADDCYCADILEVPGEQEGFPFKYVALRGSGWAEAGFPFYDDTFDPKDPYQTGKGCYALIRGKAAEKFIKLAKEDFIPSFKEISTGDYKADFVLPKE